MPHLGSSNGPQAQLLTGAWMRQLTVPAPQPSSKNQHSTAEAPEILQGAGKTPL